MASLASSLSAAGWTPFALDALSDERDEELAAWLGVLGYDALALPELRSLIKSAGVQAARERRQFAVASDSSLYFSLTVKRDTLASAASSAQALVAAKTTPVGTAAYRHWPSRVKRSLGKAPEDAALRQKLEDRSGASGRLAWPPF